MCAENYERWFKLLQVTGENLADIFGGGDTWYYPFYRCLTMWMWWCQLHSKQLNTNRGRYGV